MSKSRSGLFPRSTANAKMLRAAAYKAIHGMIAKTKGGRGKAMAIGAYDVKTGKIVTSFAGNIPSKIHPELIKRANKIGGIGSTGLSNRNKVGVCAEFHVVNELLLSGSNISDIKLTHAIRPRTGEICPYCINCTKMFSDLI